MIKNRALRYIFDFTISAIFGLAIMVSIEYTYQRYIPIEYIFNYQKLESIKGIYSVNEDLRMRSTSVYFKAKDMVWNDTLHCDFGNGDVYYSSQTTESDNFIPKSGLGVLGSNEWVYNAETPKVAAKCHIVSTVTAGMDYGIERKNTVESNYFEFK